MLSYRNLKLFFKIGLILFNIFKNYHINTIINIILMKFFLIKRLAYEMRKIAFLINLGNKHGIFFIKFLK